MGAAHEELQQSRIRIDSLSAQLSQLQKQVRPHPLRGPPGRLQGGTADEGPGTWRHKACAAPGPPLCRPPRASVSPVYMEVIATLPTQEVRREPRCAVLEATA